MFGTPPPHAPEIKDLRELYELLSPGYQGRCTAPLLVDWKTKQIVSNESSDIVRMLPLLVKAKTNKSEDIMDLCPSDLVSKIDDTNKWVYQLLNNGVYRCGFSTSQRAYQQASEDVLEGLKLAEEILMKRNFLNGTFLRNLIFGCCPPFCDLMEYMLLYLVQVEDT